MNRQEVIKLIRVCSVNYRGWPEEGKEEDTVLLWESMLGDMPYEIGQAAVKAHMSRSPFPPTIADIREAARSLTENYLSAMESWQMVVDAIRRFGYYNEDKAMASLPPDVADMVRRFSWRELCLSEQPDVLRGQWRMAWEAKIKNDRAFGVLPPDVKALAEGTAQRLKMLEGGRKAE